jgi:hypothetical protein
MVLFLIVLLIKLRHFILDISNNYVKGRLPDYDGHLFPFLSEVNMSSNLLEGNIPWSFGNLSLEVLDLSNNMFSGMIPGSLTRDGTNWISKSIKQ